MKLPSSLTTVTAFSKLLAMLIFFTFIIAAFLVGMKYQGIIDQTIYQQSNLVTAKSSPALDATANWDTFTDKTIEYSFKFPTGFKSFPNLGLKIFYSPDVQFDKTTGAKTKGLEIGSAVYGPGEDIKNDNQKYIGPNTIIDSELISKLLLPSGYIAKAYDNIEDITVTIDYKKSNEDMRILIWCGGEKGNTSECKNILRQLLPTFKFLYLSIAPTCQPRPACLDSVPRCLIPETADMCPKSTPTPNNKQVACPQIAKLCPDGSYVTASGPKCEFSACPTK